MYKLLSFLLISLLTQSCWLDDETGAKKARPTHTIMFFDKTSSVNINDAFVRNKYENALKTSIETAINTEGDELEIYYIHENTAKAKCLSMRSRTEQPDVAGLNETDIEAANSNYKMAITKERSQVFQAAMTKLLENNLSSSNLETNISGSVPLLSKAAESGMDVQAYYFSDMVESIKTGRDFHKMAPISHDQAEEWAKADAKNFKLYNLNNTTVKMILPFQPTTSSKLNNPNVTDYWKVFFETLGAINTEEI